VAVQILICDDHPLFRQGLHRLLETVADFVVVGEVERGDEVLPAVRSARPDLVMLDVELPGGSGITAAERLRAEVSDVRIVMLSGFHDPPRVRAALRAGAAGYLLKNAPPAEIIDAIHRVAAGHTVLPVAIAEVVAQSLRDEPEEERMRRRLATLSEREREVLHLASAGESNARIGQLLFISEGTVKNHITHILRKLELRDRTQAAIAVVRYGLTD
jgi:DNA-binding NarL/FixJ family response regulator